MIYFNNQGKKRRDDDDGGDGDSDGGDWGMNYPWRITSFLII